MLYNDSITSGQFLDKWKKATVTPVAKYSSAKLPSDFRPISVLSVIAKLFESLVHHQLHSYLPSNSLLHSNQFGFRPRHSTQDALLRTMDDWRLALDQGKCVGTIFIDLSKAFNSINHSMLLGKLRSYGINDLEHRWFTSYLDGRQQRVSVDGEFSEWANVITGVPQGSIPGPLLFLIYVNDLPNVVTDSTMN